LICSPGEPEQKNAISLAILIREPSIRSDKDLLKVPCNCQVNLILNDLLEVAPRPPRWSSISPNPTVVIFELLVIGSEATKNLNNVRVLGSILVRCAVNVDNEVPTLLGAMA